MNGYSVYLYDNKLLKYAWFLSLTDAENYANTLLLEFFTKKIKLRIIIYRDEDHTTVYSEQTY